MCDNIGRWWGNNPILKQEEELDVLACEGKRAIFGECKWHSGVDESVLNALKRKAEMFKNFAAASLFAYVMLYLPNKMELKKPSFKEFVLPHNKSVVKYKQGGKTPLVKGVVKFIERAERTSS